MFNSGILDFAVGLVFTFLAVSLAAGAATEAVASFLKMRSRTLLQGVKDLLNDPDLNALAGDVYKHALINPRGDGSASSDPKTNPAYIEPAHFAAAFLDILKDGATIDPAQKIQDLKNAVDAKLPAGKNDQIKTMINGIIDRAAGEEEKIRAELSSWFDNAMDRVGGSYKRWSQLWSFVFALVFAEALNISAIDVAKTLWHQPIDTKDLVDTTDKTDLTTVLKRLNELPIGWPAGIASKDQAAQHANLVAFLGRCPCDWDWARIVGWLITAFAALFGAPFWFDALQQIVRLKGSGPSPAEKGTPAAAAK
jgi:hypothetical protein